MKIAVIVRTLNEEKNVRRFCDSYFNMFRNDGIRIFVADGGSTDNTIPILETYNPLLVEFREFTEQIEVGGHKVNPRGKHINFLINWAESLKPDWIIFDDVDCVPSRDMQYYVPAIMESSLSEMVFAYRLFMLGENKYFPDMNLPNGQSLWAWHPICKIRADESSPLNFTMQIPNKASKMNLDKPYSLLHYFYPDEETFQRKKAQYVATGEVPEYYDPVVQFGRIEEAPMWAKWQ